MMCLEYCESDLEKLLYGSPGKTQGGEPMLSKVSIKDGALATTLDGRYVEVARLILY